MTINYHLTVLPRGTMTKMRVWIGNYNTTADLHNLQSLHANLLSLSARVITDL
jgi:hypothetical protein